MGNNSVPKFIFRLSGVPVYRGSVLGRFYCSLVDWNMGTVIQSLNTANQIQPCRCVFYWTNDIYSA